MKQTGGFASRLHTPALQKCLSGAYLREPPMEQPRLEERTGTFKLVSVLGDCTIAAEMHRPVCHHCQAHNLVIGVDDPIQMATGTTHSTAEHSWGRTERAQKARFGTTTQLRRKAS